MKATCVLKAIALLGVGYYVKQYFDKQNTTETDKTPPIDPQGNTNNSIGRMYGRHSAQYHSPYHHSSNHVAL